MTCSWRPPPTRVAGTPPQLCSATCSVLLSQLGSEEGGQLAILTALGLGVNLAACSRRGRLLWEMLSPLATWTQLSPGFRLLSPCSAGSWPLLSQLLPCHLLLLTLFPRGPYPNAMTPIPKFVPGNCLPRRVAKILKEMSLRDCRLIPVCFLGNSPPKSQVILKKVPTFFIQFTLYCGTLT